MRDTIFIHDPFHKASYQENSNEIKYTLKFVQECYDEPDFREKKFCPSRYVANTNKGVGRIIKIRIRKRAFQTVTYVMILFFVLNLGDLF